MKTKRLKKKSWKFELVRVENQGEFCKTSEDLY